MDRELLQAAREGAARCSCSRTSHKRDVNCPVHGTQAGNRALLEMAKEAKPLKFPRRESEGA